MPRKDSYADKFDDVIDALSDTMFNRANDEVTKLEEYLDTKSENTGKSYRRFYKMAVIELRKPISLASEVKILEYSKTQPTTNTAQGVLNIAIVVRKMYDLDVSGLEKHRTSNKEKIVVEVSNKLKQLKEDKDLPTYYDLQEYLQGLYNDAKWQEYIINYLLIHYQTRNEDLNLELCLKKSEAECDSLNYLWVTKGKVIFYRKNYKTVKTYGHKTIEITDPNFRNACMKMKKTTMQLIPNDKYAGYYVKKVTLNELGEATYMKIIVFHFKDNLNKLREISTNRGTSLDTIARDYNLDIDV